MLHQSFRAPEKKHRHKKQEEEFIKPSQQSKKYLIQITWWSRIITEFHR